MEDIITVYKVRRKAKRGEKCPHCDENRMITLTGPNNQTQRTTCACYLRGTSLGYTLDKQSVLTMQGLNKLCRFKHSNENTIGIVEDDEVINISEFVDNTLSNFGFDVPIFKTKEEAIIWLKREEDKTYHIFWDEVDDVD